MATEALLPQKLREFLRIASKYGADHALSEIVDQSHAARSDSTCAAASTTCHSSQPGPCSFIMESSGDVWRGGETWNDLLRHDRRSRFARAFSFSYNGSDRFLMFRVATEGLHCSSILEELTKIANRPTLSSKWVVPTTEYPSGSYRTPIASHRRIALRSPPSERRNAVADRNKKYRNSGTGRTTAMAETMFSGIEHALENQRLGSLQIRVAAICGLIQMCDGYDVGSIGWSVPSLTHAWHLAPPAFALAFLWSSIGIMAGALLAGPIGDRFGRKPLLMMSVTLFGIASLASAVSPSLGFLAGTRFFTGMGIAGGFAGTVALTGDYTPRRLRAMMIMLTFTGAPLGGFVGGLLVSLLLHEGFGWQMIFVIGGVFPLVLLAITALWLPESPRLLAARANLAPRHYALLQRLAITHSPGEVHTIDLARGNPIRALFTHGYALQTILL
jgi:Major Facilitator Superfamily